MQSLASHLDSEVCVCQCVWETVNKFIHIKWQMPNHFHHSICASLTFNSSNNNNHTSGSMWMRIGEKRYKLGPRKRNNGKTFLFDAKQQGTNCIFRYVEVVLVRMVVAFAFARFELPIHFSVLCVDCWRYSMATTMVADSRAAVFVTCHERIQYRRIIIIAVNSNNKWIQSQPRKMIFRFRFVWVSIQVRFSQFRCAYVPFSVRFP